MKNLFSIIYIPLNSNLQEKISIGLIMFNDEKNIFKISYPKLNVIKNLISQNKFNNLKAYFNNIISELNPQVDNYKLAIEHNNSNNWIKESYFHYLNKYSNNLVIYSDPKNIEMEITEENFRWLFNKLVYTFEEELVHIKSEDIISKVKTRLYSKIEDRVNLNVTVSSKDFTELLTPVDVNFLGKNGVVVAGQTVDFDKRLYNLENDLTRFISFTKAVDYSCNKKGKYFLVGQEPNKKEHPNNHKTWKHVKQSHLVEYVDLSEAEKIKEYIITKDVTPYFKKAETST